MNRAYTENELFVSDNGIYDILYGESAHASRSRQKAWDALLARLFALYRILTGATVRRLARVCGVALSLVGILGVAGAMEAGRLPLAAGLLLCAVLVGTEILCLLPARKKKEQG